MLPVIDSIEAYEESFAFRSIVLSLAVASAAVAAMTAPRAIAEKISLFIGLVLLQI